MKQRIGLVFGGKSGEHEVSIESARSIAQALDKSKYEVVLIGIDKQGQWRLGNSAHALLEDSGNRLNSEALSVIPVSAPSGGVELVDPVSGDSHQRIDVFFPIAHGTFGEDGCLQGFLRLLDVPFVGAGVLGSAVGMDKDVMKRLLRDAGIPIGNFVALRSRDMAHSSFSDVVEYLGLPFFVKPANMGSSVGVSKVADAEGYERALALAFSYDTKVIVEEAIPGREIECSVLGNDKPMASVPGEVIVQHDFYSYQAKYQDENGAILEIPAKLDESTMDRVRELAIAAFLALECCGMARVDFFLQPDGALFVNEINTLPGFTRISMYPKLWEATGLRYSHLLDALIALAQERHADERCLKRSFLA